ncbi:MAG: aspartate aminotransferase family protein [Sphingobacteriales bacterium 17-39-43]|uniref:aspartate aminotransferase family protein n=1 Tax=Daejeonella sp. TaxID=2805397 RepID=UPI000BDB0AEB|nr:aspartate aminotransferase family protein [Daejeonella sp.]OYZ31770.1 MAG: aspartate aminotransferase family protein [Sphingobacteriales bacterium 16-39-50]OZA24905.1 MAG: aspartate aminotransferase family protein [Sphingobacteriales bacterium 17-39-43]OZA58168.1 MAG: aspartate aminotransferase family protein [Sphingobacteriales bacterium 39-40-5]HQS51951.1 aspartate aminotransferase family protein [Daejeonella sp.]HQT22838.1 aspartate aminotransferase family protein [Daejeonella sp.]
MEIRSYNKSAKLLERAKRVLAGGVSSEFRKYNHPHALFYTHGKGSRIYDADGNEYLDFTLSQGPLILGHSHPHVLKSINEYSAGGQLFAGQHIREIELAEKINQLIPTAELMRFCLDGSEAIHTAFRLARAKTGKKKFLRFEGHYHGWLDNVCWGISAPSEEALGSRESPEVFPWSDGLAISTRDECIVIPWNDAELLKATVEKHYKELAAIITEPVMCNNGCIMPNPGFLQMIRELCSEYNITFILDEVITGFRLSLGGAQQFFNIQPDLSIFAKALASGYPISVIAGKKEWMRLIEEAKVIHAGTMNSGNATIAAALATIEVLEKEHPYGRMFSLGKELMQGIRDAAKQTGHNLLVQGPGPMFNLSFTEAKEINEFRATLSCNKAKLGSFIAGMHNEGVRIIGRGLWYISAVHTQDDINFAIEKVRKVLKNI